MFQSADLLSLSDFPGDNFENYYMLINAAGDSSYSFLEAAFLKALGVCENDPTDKQIELYRESNRIWRENTLPIIVQGKLQGVWNNRFRPLF